MFRESLASILLPHRAQQVRTATQGLKELRTSSHTSDVGIVKSFREQLPTGPRGASSRVRCRPAGNA